MGEKNASNVILKTETYSFDADGNRLTKTDGTNTAQYKYDRRGRQLGVNNTVYELNDGDVRTAKVDGTRTEYVMEGLKLEAEIANGTTTATYRWGMQLIGESRGGANKTILQDRFRSPLILLDQTGGISDRVRYTAAGEVRQRVGSSPLAFGYGGYLTQSGTDELYAFARTYSPGMARFNENDPVRSFDPMLSMGPHRYVLGYGNPLSYVDPDGRVPALVEGANALRDTHKWLGESAKSYDNSALGFVGTGATGIAGAFVAGTEGFLRGVNYGANWAGLAAATAVGSETADDFATEIQGTHQTADHIVNGGGLVDAYEAARENTVQTYEGNAQAFGKTVEVGAGLIMGGRVSTTNLSAKGRRLEAIAREMDSQLATGTTVVESTSTLAAHRASPLAKLCGTGQCFVAGTPVMTIEGLKPIETIQVGELVASRNDLTQQTRWQRVEALIVTHDREVLDLAFVDQNGKIELITGTPEHPFHTSGRGWVEAKDLEPAETIHTLDGRTIQLLSKHANPHSATTYNLTVENDHTYFVGNSGIWVHNTCCDFGNIPDEHHWRYERYLNGPSPKKLAPDAWFTSAQRAWKNNENGNGFEQTVRTELGAPLGKGSKSVSIDGFVPDLPVGKTYGVTDIKDWLNLNNSPQLRAFYSYAVKNDLPFNLVMGTRTKSISQSVLDGVRETKGSVTQYNPATREFSPVEIAPSGPWKRD